MPRATVIHVLLCTFAVSSVAGVYFDMTDDDPVMDTPCPKGNPQEGIWTKEDVGLYPDPPEGPLDGKVLKSELRTTSCIRTPQLFEVDEDHQFQMYVHMPETIIGDKTRKVLVWLVDEDDKSYPIIQLKGPSEAKWHLIRVDVPKNPDFIYPKPFKVNEKCINKAYY
jgi:hypothetical protein